MVQRKFHGKLGIQADHVKTEKRLGLGTLKTSSCQRSDGKNHDLKKRMKKSRSIKLSDPMMRNTTARPAKPPPLPISVPEAAVTPQKKSVIKPMDGSPNYMKSTSSSQAKKESSQVSSQNAHYGSYTKNLHRRSSGGSNFISGSGSKPVRALTRTTSLKMVRTLTKSPTFKPARTSAKKCTRVALCADMTAQRATCSSTLKDSKFPAYLMLNPGGNESEGTSVIKVCPYTYCSLNGHYQTPLPLKCFIKAKRRSLKNLRSMNMEALSSPRLKPSGNGDGTEELDAKQVDFGNRPASNGMDSGKSYMSPIMQERCMDYFIEIYAKGKGDDVRANGGSSPTNTERMDDSGCGSNETVPEYDADKPVSESLSEGSPQSEIDFDEEMNYNERDEDFREILVKEESPPWNFHDGDQKESFSSISVEHAMFEVIDMKWEEWQFSTSDNDAHSPLETDDESDLNIPNSSKNDSNNLFDGLGISFGESNSNITVAEVIISDRAEQEVFVEDTAFIDAYGLVSEIVYDDQVSSTEDVFEVFVAKKEEKEEENIEICLGGIIAIPSSTEEQYERPTSGKEELPQNGVPGTVNEDSESDPHLEIPKNCCAIDVKDETLESTEQFLLHSFNKLEQGETNEDNNIIQKLEDSEANRKISISDFIPDEELPSGEVAGDRMEADKVADAELLIGSQISDSSHVLFEADEDNQEVDDKQDNQYSKVNDAIDEGFSTQETDDEILFDETQDYLSSSKHENTNVEDNKNIIEEDQEETKFKVPTSMNSKEQSCSRIHKISLVECNGEPVKIELEGGGNAEVDVAETFPTTASDHKTSHKLRNIPSFTRKNAKKELHDNHNKRKWEIRRKRHEVNNEETRKFNPREPNFLPVILEKDAEKVDLRHQMIDERKNAEEWMLDHALQQAVTKLAPARKKKVALLVEAFETVLPVTKCETNLRHTSTSAGFGHGRPIQACN